MSNELLKVVDLTKWFKVKKGGFSFSSFSKDSYIKAVNKVNFSIMQGDNYGLVGETGSGKTTIGDLILLLQEPTSGEIFWKGSDILKSKKALSNLRRNSHMIFQNITASLNPRKSIEDILALPLKIEGIKSWRDRRKKVIELLNKVGLTPGAQFLRKHPHELSGGQRQRVDIARAIAVNPEFIIADEPVASLDVSIRSQIVNLLDDLKKEFNITYLWITHDLTMVRYISNWVTVLYLGKVMESAKKDDLFNSPKHPYTKALLSAIPEVDPLHKSKYIKLRGEMPSPINLPTGCVFHTRCLNKFEECTFKEPELIDKGNGHLVACHMFA